MSMKRVVSGMQYATTYGSAPTKNYENFPAWEIPLEKRFQQVLFTGSFGNSFYVNQRDMITASIKAIEQGIQKLPLEYIKRVIVEARHKGFMRTAPITAIVLLRKAGKVDSFKELFPQVILTGNDLEDFFSITRAFDMGFGQGVKKVVNKWLNEKANQFYAIKYKRQLRDAMRISHPKGENIVLDYIAYSTFKANKLDKAKAKEILEQLPQVKYFELAKISLANNEIEKAIEYIKLGKVPTPAILGIAGNIKSRKLWTELMHQMGTMQLLKYINKLDKFNVFSDESGVYYDKENMEYLKQRFSIENLQKAKILPFRLLIASQYVKDKSISSFLLDLSLEYAKQYDWGKWKGTWVIAPDISGSMDSVTNGKMKPCQVAAMFSGILKAGLPESYVFAWGSTLDDLTNETPKEILEEVAYANGGGTYMELPVQRMVHRKIKADYLLIITDSEEWGAGWLTHWKQYKKFNPEAKAIIIRVDSYNTQPYSEKDAVKYDIYDVFGWNNNVLDWIQEVVLEG